jgi:hypothetical protein
MKITIIILGIVAAILIALRVYLPFYIKDQINENINEMEGFAGGVENVSLSLLRGNIYLSGIAIYNEDYPDPSIPFVRVARNEIFVDWGSLFNRRLVAEIHVDSLLVNYVIYEDVVEEEEVDIVGLLTDLMDFQIDMFITNGTINFADIMNDPHVEFSLTDISLQARYLTNEVMANDTLPSTIQISATAMTTGSIESTVRVNYMKDVPDFDFELELENLNITEFNEIARAYGGFEFENGLLYVYTEAAANDGLLVGYIKPIVDEIEIVPEDDDPGIFERFYTSVMDFAASILESPDEELLATQVEFEGRIDDPEVDTWAAIWNLLRNGFIEGFSKGIEQAIDFEMLTD